MPAPRFKYFVSPARVLGDGLALLSSRMDDVEAVSEFEANLARTFDRCHCVTFSSFRMGLYFYLKNLNLKKGDEVLLSPVTIPDVVNIILLLDLKPIFVDLNFDDQLVDIDDLKKKISSKSKCLILTYLSGIVTHNNELKDLCRSNNLIVIEDISQSYGTRSQSNSSPYWGDVHLGSLSSGKVISSYTGGFLLTNDPLLYENLKRQSEELSSPPKKRFVLEIVSNLKITLATSKLIFPLIYPIIGFLWLLSPDFFSSLSRAAFNKQKSDEDLFFDSTPTRRFEIPNGWKTYLNSWQARIGIRSLKNLNARTQVRHKRGNQLIKNLHPSVRAKIPSAAHIEGFNFYHLPFYVSEPHKEQWKLFKKGIDTGGYGLPLCSDLPIFQEYFQDCPKARKIKEKCIFIPVHESFSKKNIDKMAHIINKVCSAKKEEVTHVSA